MVMKKKQYQGPNMTVVNVIIESLLDVNSIKGENGGLKMGGGGSGVARGREYDDWDE